MHSLARPTRASSGWKKPARCTTRASSGPGVTSCSRRLSATDAMAPSWNASACRRCRRTIEVNRHRGTTRHLLLGNQPLATLVVQGAGAPEPTSRHVPSRGVARRSGAGPVERHRSDQTQLLGRCEPLPKRLTSHPFSDESSVPGTVETPNNDPQEKGDAVTNSVRFAGRSAALLVLIALLTPALPAV